MAAGIIYRIQATNVEGKFIKVDILDNSVEADGDPHVVELQGGGSPIVISSVDEGEQKTTTIRAQQCTITFLSDSVFGVHTFASGADNRFGVIVLYDTTIVFEGFLSLDDNREQFIDGRNEVVLTGNDKLAALKNIPWVDEAGNNPKGKFTIAETVALCLLKTGLQKEIRVVNSLKHGSGTREVTNVEFVSGLNYIEVDFNVGYFYPGMLLTISGSVSNNMTTEVLRIEDSTTIVVKDNLVTETATIYNITFTDASEQPHFFEHYIDALTMEEDIDTSISCYDVLDRILKGWGELFYMNFNWWIVRLSEKYQDSLTIAQYSEFGSLNGFETQSFNKAFGIDEDHWFSQEQTDIHPQRPQGLVKLTYKYEFPKEIICNINFENGAFIEDLDPEVVDDELMNVKTYEIDCWEKILLDRSTGAETPDTTVDIFIKRWFNELGYETGRTAVSSFGTYDGDSYHYMKSLPVMMGKGDKFDFSGDWRIDDDKVGDEEESFRAFMFLLEGDDGETYVWSRGFDPPFDIFTFKWRPLAEVGLFYSYSYDYIPDYSRTSEWQSASVSIGQLPVSGKVYFYLNNWNQVFPLDPQNTYWQNIKLDYKPYINQSFLTYTGEFHAVKRAEPGYLATIDEEVHLGDAPRPIFKGAIFFPYNDTYRLTSRWREGGGTTYRPFLWWLSFGIWNQYRLEISVMEFSTQGFEMIIPHTIHNIDVTDIDPLTIDRIFGLLTFEKDLYLCEMTGTIAELYRTTDGYSYTDPYEFKYIS